MFESQNKFIENQSRIQKKLYMKSEAVTCFTAQTDVLIKDKYIR